MSVDILKISKDAIAASKIYDDVINASIGMFYDEDKSIGGMPVVSKAIRSLPDDKILPYPAVDGGADFKNNVISWVLGKYEDSIRKQMFINEIGKAVALGILISFASNL